MITVDKKQFQQILITALGDENRTKFVMDKYTFKNYIGEPVTQTIKLRCVQNVLETFLSVIKLEDEEVDEELKESVQSLLEAVKNDLKILTDRKYYQKKYYEAHKGE